MRRAQPNEIIINEEYAEIVIYSKNQYFCMTSIDLEDVEEVSNTVWWINWNGYIEGNINKKRTLLHRHIMKPSDQEEVDHIDDELYGDKKLDNRRQNLRICNRSENNMNRNRNRNKSTSIYKDVFENDISHYRVVINGENYGTYSNEVAAANAYNYYVKDIHGDFAFYMDTRFMEKEEWMNSRRYLTSPNTIKSSTNTSGYAGIRFNRNRWQVSISIEGAEFYIGRFTEKKEAIKTRNKAVEIKNKNIDNMEECKRLLQELNQNSTKSGIKGVTWCKKKELWIARIQRNKKRINLGEFKQLEEARKAREQAEKAGE